jgi:hypothetical protein
MRPLKIIFFVIAGLLFLFGAAYLLGSGSPSAQGSSTSWVLIGTIFIVVGFVAVFVATRFKTPKEEITNVTVNVDLPGNVSMDTLKCKSCGGTLSPNDVKMVAGAPVVTCPYCHTTYQLTEEPKW